MTTPPNPYGQPQYGYPPPAQPYGQQPPAQPYGQQPAAPVYGQPPAAGYGYPAAPVPPQPGPPVPPVYGQQQPGYGAPGYPPPPGTPQAGWGQQPPPTPPPGRRIARRITLKLIGLVGGVIALVVAYLVLGPSVSSASVGSCVHTSGSSNVSIVKCTDPTAQYKVVAKYTGTTDTSRCDTHPEATASVWGSSGRRTSKKKYVLCLGPLDGAAPAATGKPSVSPSGKTSPSGKASPSANQTSPQPGKASPQANQNVPSDISRAKAGDCLRNDHQTSDATADDSNPDITMLPCTDPKAQYKVIAKVSGTADSDTACAKYPNYTSSYYRDGGAASFVLCLTDTVR